MFILLKKMKTTQSKERTQTKKRMYRSFCSLDVGKRNDIILVNASDFFAEELNI